MKTDLAVLSTQQVEGTTARKKMKLSQNASQMVFKMFTKNVYSNPIGTVVREITSNCFDSHVEAGVPNTPVLIKKSHDTQTDTHYISFIDYGVGMSPDRIENIYGVYFESTKRNTNDEIGGFGIGGKTPLAYMRSTGEGEGEYDNSFFVITNYNGTKYYYTVFEGPESPEFSLFHSEPTEEHNGTEIRIPILTRDIDKFEKELVQQLFYFEGIVFEGWSDNVSNDYQIIRGKNFLFRPDSFDEYIHVCLGKVYYPINYNTLGLSNYDYQIPVAINVPIGAIGMTVSREQLDYSEATIKYLKKALDTVREELKTMLTKQYDNVCTLEQYFQYKTDFGKLWLTDEHSIRLSGFVKSGDVNLKKFKYNDVFNKIPDTGSMFNAFFKVQRHGKKENTSWRSDSYPVLEHSYEGLIKMSEKSRPNIYCSEPADYNLKRIKQSYLKSLHTRFYVIVPKDLRSTDNVRKLYDVFNISFETYDKFMASDMFKNILAMQEDYMEIVRKFAPDYTLTEVPEDYKDNYGKKRLTTELLKTSIPVKFGNRYSKERIPMKDLVEFNGTIYYGNPDEEWLCNKADGMFDEMYNSKYVATSHSKWNNHNVWDGKEKSIMFINIARANMKYMQYCKKAIPVRQFFHKYIARKEDEILTLHRNQDLINSYEKIHNFYKTEMFKHVSPEWSEIVVEIKSFTEGMKDSRLISNYMGTLKEYINFDSIELTEAEKDIRKKIEEIMFLQDVNRDALRYLNVPDRHYYVHSKEEDMKVLPDLLRKVLTL